MDIDTDALAENFRRLSQSIKNINEDKQMYKVRVDIIDGYNEGDKITTLVYNGMLDYGCPKGWFEKIGPEFEVGDWVITEEGALVRLGKKRGDKWRENIYIGDNHKSYPNSGEYIFNSVIERHATPEEIKEHLTEEAKKRGLLKEGQKNKALLHKELSEKYTTSLVNKIKAIRYNPDRDYLALYYGPCHGDFYRLYYEGEWAEIVDTTPDIEINGYKAKKKGELLKFGCLDADKKTVALLRNSIHKYGLDIVREGEKINKQIHEIHEYYK